ncbi:transglycosylase domain-containing protein [Arthrobacter sp. PsM3]|uniref:transglycosylase domain-containing protein n=1 Tax=Arthrobacter sp. PsM3 TaxID=3030531 RepID=UPI00263B0D3B|nr:transglycosylase domain-containing protein [Arthrobacter sp. PsM3]MDN4645277.1 transglycosylase domain-containing protein [Arthrobacter sp. PsM3]
MSRPGSKLFAAFRRVASYFTVSAVCGVLAASLVVPALAGAGVALRASATYFNNLPSELTVDPPSQSTKVLTADGKTIAIFYAENRVKVGLDQMSPFIKDAIVAVEDRRFYEHAGVDPQGILRALASNLTGGSRQGASTLTQQYVTNVLNESLVSADKGDRIVLNGQKSFGDKVREMRLAIELEKKYTKDEILAGYLNIVFFSRDAYGIEAASRYFFSTTAKGLTLPQAALLAGLVKSPSFYNPLVYPDNAIQRRNHVLDAMLSLGRISQADHDAAAASGVDLNITPGRQGCAAAEMAPYFCDYVSHLILNNPAYGVDLAARVKKLYRGGLTITTTLDSRLQLAAQAQVDATAGANPDKWGASLVSIGPGTGKILAMAQNTVFLPEPGKFDTQLNFNVDSKDARGDDLNGAGGFQPGSTMKPFTLAEWLQEGKSLADQVDASRRSYPLGFRWKSSCGKILGAYDTAQKSLGAADDLQNNDAGYYRRMRVDYGVYNSINTATFAEAAQLDFCGIQKMVDSAGIHSGLDNAPVNMHQLGNLLGAIGVAPLVLANAFATFANDGKYCEPVAIVDVTDAAGQQLPAEAKSCRDAIKPNVARGVTSVLQDVLIKGSGVYIKPKVQSRFPVAAKTGTSNTNGATWVVGYTSGLATASFFGDALDGQNRPGQNITVNGQFYKSIDGYMLAGPQWANYMLEVAGLYPAGAFPPPPESMTKKPG